MVILHVKHGEKSLFQIETTQQCNIEKTLEDICFLHNGRRKVIRICQEIEQLSLYGSIISNPHENESQCEPEGGTSINKDPSGKRCGKMPCDEMQTVLFDTVGRATKLISCELQKSGNSLTQNHIQECLDILKGAVSLVYLNGLPKQDPILLELQNAEILSESQAKEIFVPSNMQLWFGTKQMELDKKLSDYFGKNEKSKVIVKVQQKGGGIPIREPFITDEQKRKLMLDEFNRRETLKKLEEHSRDDNSYLDSEWADSSHLKKSFHGLDNVSWRPR